MAVTLVNLSGFAFGIVPKKEQLPPHWHFEENPMEFLMAVAPDVRRFYWDGGSIVHEQERDDFGNNVAGPRRNIQDVL